MLPGRGESNIGIQGGLPESARCLSIPLRRENQAHRIPPARCLPLRNGGIGIEANAPYAAVFAGSCAPAFAASWGITPAGLEFRPLWLRSAYSEATA